LRLLIMLMEGNCMLRDTLFSRLLKNTHLLRSAHPSSLRRTKKYASFLRILRDLHLDVFDQPGRKQLFQQPVSKSALCSLAAL